MPAFRRCILLETTKQMTPSDIDTFWWHVTSSGRIVLFWRFKGHENTVQSRILPPEFDVGWFMSQKVIAIKDFIVMTDDELESFIMMVKIDAEALSQD